MHIKTKFQNKKIKSRKISVTWCRHFFQAKFCQVKYIAKKELAQKKFYEWIKTWRTWHQGKYTLKSFHTKPFQLIVFRNICHATSGLFLNGKKTETFPIKIGNAFERNISSVSQLNKFYSKKEKNRMMRMIY